MVNRTPLPIDPKPVQLYREAVERAATDRARRTRREEALIAFVSGDEQVAPEEDLEDEEKLELANDDDEYDEEYADRY